MKMAEVAGSRWTIRGGSSNEGMRMQADFGRKIELSSGDALLLVNVQNDFLGGGAVPVPGAEAVIPLMNDYLARFASESLPVFAIRDWHPLNHCSFQSRGWAFADSLCGGHEWRRTAPRPDTAALDCCDPQSHHPRQGSLFRF